MWLCDLDRLGLRHWSLPGFIGPVSLIRYLLHMRGNLLDYIIPLLFFESLMHDVEYSLIFLDHIIEVSIILGLCLLLLSLMLVLAGLATTPSYDIAGRRQGLTVRDSPIAWLARMHGPMLN